MDIRFAFPLSQLPLWLGVAAVILATVWAGLRLMERRRSGRLHRFVEAALAPRLLLGYDARMRRPLTWLTVLGVAMLALAFMQPRWGQDWVDVQRGSRDVLVLLDVSQSMNAPDPVPSRMARAKQKVEALMEMAPGDRFGLVAFAGDASLQCPLTLDHAYYRTILNAVGSTTVSTMGTDIGEALFEAMRTFKEDAEKTGSAERHQRVVLLISDGEQVSGDALDAADRIAEMATVNVMGIGSEEGAKVPFPQMNNRGRGLQGQEHVSKLDEETLKRIALNTEGVYVRSTPHAGDVELIYEEMGNLAARAVSSELRFNMVNRYRWPLAVAIACFFAEGLWLGILPWIRKWRMRRLGAHAGDRDYRAEESS
jgi:Ca-activated chloride channel family protein